MLVRKRSSPVGPLARVDAAVLNKALGVEELLPADVALGLWLRPPLPGQPARANKS